MSKRCVEEQMEPFGGLSMYAGHESGMPCIVLVIFQEKLASLFVQGRLRERLYEEASNDQQNVAQTKARLPVLLQHIDADLTVLGDVGVKDLGQEVAYNCGEGISTGLRWIVCQGESPFHCPGFIAAVETSFSHIHPNQD